MSPARRGRARPLKWPDLGPRPRELFTAGCCYRVKDLRAILEKPDSSLDWPDFAIFFKPARCVATYEQAVYFLPLALDYLRREPMHGREYVYGLVHFLSRPEDADRIEEDKLSGPCRTALQACFDSWIETFEVVHFDEEACRNKGWRLGHFDYVKNSEAVIDLIDTLVLHRRHEDLAVDLLSGLCH